MVLTKEKFIYKGKYNKTFSILVADNGFGKTQLLQTIICYGVAKEKIFVLNTSRQSDWNSILPAKNIFLPVMFSTKYIEQFMLEFMMTHSDCLLIIDDIDAYQIKKSEILYKIIREARHSNVGLVAATALMQRLPSVYYQQAEYLFVGPQSNEYNVRYLSTTNVPRKDADVYLSLEQYQFAVWVRSERKTYVIKVDINSFKR